MARKTPKTPKPKAEDIEVTTEEVQELERDMRSAKITAWIEDNQRALIYAAAGVLILIFGGVMWQEQQQSHRVAAASFYHQALDTADPGQKRALFYQVVQDFHGTSYAPFSLLQLSAIEPDMADKHLETLLDHPMLTPELMYQGSIDLAEIYIRKGEKDKARALVEKDMGEDYEQLRRYLLAQLAENDAEKANQYRMALDAESHDENLKATIQRLLAEL